MYWKYFQNIRTFTYQKTLLHKLLLLVFKIAESLQCIVILLHNYSDQSNHFQTSIPVTYSELSQTSMTKLFSKMLKGWKPLTSFVKSSILNAGQGSEYTSALFRTLSKDKLLSVKRYRFIKLEIEIIHSYSKFWQKRESYHWEKKKFPFHEDIGHVTTNTVMRLLMNKQMKTWSYKAIRCISEIYII